MHNKEKRHESLALLFIQLGKGGYYVDEFKIALDKAIDSWLRLGAEWDKIEESHSDKLSEKYPFDKDFREVLHDLMDWKESLK